MSQFASFAYGTFAFGDAPYANLSVVLPITIPVAFNDTCAELEVLECVSGPRSSLELPVYTSTAAGAHFCVINATSADLGLIFAFRGSLSTSDFLVDASVFERKIKTAIMPTANGSWGSAGVHGAMLQVWQRSAADLVAAWVARAPNLPLYFTGHSLGGALAAFAAHDTCITARQATLSGSGSRMPSVHLYSQGKPEIGGAAWEASFQQLMDEGYLVNVRRHVNVIGETMAADIATNNFEGLLCGLKIELSPNAPARNALTLTQRPNPDPNPDPTVDSALTPTLVLILTRTLTLPMLGHAGPEHTPWRL